MRFKMSFSVRVKRDKVRAKVRAYLRPEYQFEPTYAMDRRTVLGIHPSSTQCTSLCSPLQCLYSRAEVHFFLPATSSSCMQWIEPLTFIYANQKYQHLTPVLYTCFLHQQMVGICWNSSPLITWILNNFTRLRTRRWISPLQWKPNSHFLGAQFSYIFIFVLSHILQKVIYVFNSSFISFLLQLLIESISFHI